MNVARSVSPGTFECEGATIVPARVFVFLLLIAFAISMVAKSSAARPDTQQDLRKAAENFVRSIEARDAGAVLAQFSKDGTSFVGTAFSLKQPPVPFQEIQKDFEAKTGIYCLFFDTKCFQEEDARERKQHNGRSLRSPLSSIGDLIAHGKTKRFLAYDHGKVTLLLSDRTPDSAFLGQDAVNFYLRHEAGQWKIANIEYN